MGGFADNLAVIFIFEGFILVTLAHRNRIFKESSFFDLSLSLGLLINKTGIIFGQMAGRKQASCSPMSRTGRAKR